MSYSSRFVQTANEALRAGRYGEAMENYFLAFQRMPEIAPYFRTNIDCVRKKFLAAEKEPRVAVCGWEMAHNAAGRAHTLADIYQKFTEVELIGSIFSRWGNQVWEPIRDEPIPMNFIFVNDAKNFPEQALHFVLKNPFSIVHLSKPRAPNIIFGLLYKLIWEARVILDIDEEELAFVGAQESCSIASYIKSNNSLPSLDLITERDWTSLAAGLCDQFDEVTVSNCAVQSRYGGTILAHARDEKKFIFDSTLRSKTRAELGIKDKDKVVLFSGTPRPHKGLLETALAIQALDRNDIVYVIAGSFGEFYAEFKKSLTEITGVRYIFIENQPFSSIQRLLAIADCCVLMQSTAHDWTTFQIPAKLSDALAMGIPVIVSQTPALADVISSGAVIVADNQNLPDKLALALDHDCAKVKKSALDYFNNKLSIKANKDILQKLILDPQSRPLSPRLKKLFFYLTNQSIGFFAAKNFLTHQIEPSPPSGQDDKSSKPRKTNGFNLVGYATSPLGLGEDLRQSAYAFLDAGIPITIVDIPTESTNVCGDDLRKFMKNSCDRDTTIFFMSPFAYSYTCIGKPGFGENGYKIGNFLWELEDFPRESLHILDHMDEIWSPTEFVANIYKKVGFENIYLNSAPAAPLPAQAGNLRHMLGIDEETFIFGFMFDLHSTFSRKNPFALVKSYLITRENLPQNIRTALVIKIHRSTFRSVELLKLKNLCKNHPDIVIFEKTLENASIFYNTIDAYISLHRSEGLGRTLIEAAQSGIPVLCTEYSGSQDIIKLGGAIAVPYKLTTCHKGEYPRSDISVWAEPDIQVAAKEMTLLAQQGRQRTEAPASLNAYFSRKSFIQRVKANFCLS